MGALIDHIRSYYNALNTGDPARVAEHFTEDATHYYTRLGPHNGAKTIGEHTKWAVENIEGQWFIENAVEAASAELLAEMPEGERGPVADELDAVNEQMRSALAASDLEDWAKADGRFHRLLVERSGNGRLVRPARRTSHTRPTT